MDEPLQRETERLTRSWQQYDREMLRDYLVADVEDPRLNVQSMLTRHYLIVHLTGTRFERLLEEELRFAVVLNWLLQLAKRSEGPEERAAIAHALATGADNAEGLPLPPYLRAAFVREPGTIDGALVPNYLRAALRAKPAGPGEPFLPQPILNTFQAIWREVLAREATSGLSVMEAACGSANDARYLEAFGLMRLVRYQGFDLSEKNVQNARALLPGAPFTVGNVLEIPEATAAIDHFIAHDLLEHLSPAALERALGEITRVTRRGLCLGFFSMHEGPEHVVRPVDDYHWNTLSLPQIRARLESEGFEVRVVHIGTMLQWRFGCTETHNRTAYMVFGSRNGNDTAYSATNS